MLESVMLVVLNFGSQLAHLIARRVRELGVHAEILPFNTPAEELRALAPAGIILSGGPASVLDKRSPRPDAGIFALGAPLLGICYGHQVMAAILGGRVVAGAHKEFGKEALHIRSRTGVFKGLPARETVWFSHGDRVAKLPRGFTETASTDRCANAAMADTTRRFYGIQFHPEASHTAHGMHILRNFITLCGAKRDWRPSALAPKLVEEICETVGDEHVVVGISGGVDSLVAATLIHQAIGNRLHAVFVDTGLLRKGEVREVSRALRRTGFRGLHVIDASKLFLTRLRGVTDPEEKRRIIGHSFIEVFERTLARALRRYPIRYLAQGTIYPDRIESAGVGSAGAKIKSHHNLTLPEKLGFKLLEPLADFYKDEVRKVGETLGLPHELVWRHPFPGPGLAIRVVGEVTPERLAILREADAIFIEELRAAGAYEKIWQAFAALLPVKAVGVMGDARTHAYIIALRAVDSVDGMSADWHKMPPALLERISTRIVNEVRGANRVLYDVTQKPPGTVEYE